MNRPRNPDGGVDSIASAMDLTARVAAAVVAMVVPGLAGQWLDQRWETSYLALLGFLFGVPFGIYYLLETSRTFSGRRGDPSKPQKSPSRRDSAATSDHELTPPDHEQPSA